MHCVIITNAPIALIVNMVGALLAGFGVASLCLAIAVGTAATVGVALNGGDCLGGRHWRRGQADCSIASGSDLQRGRGRRVMTTRIHLT